MTKTKSSPRKFAGYQNALLRAIVLQMVDHSGFTGMTSQEVEAHFDPETEAHHGDVSGCLALLHRDLVLARLSEKREGHKVYVHRDFLAGRKPEAQGNGKNKLSQDEIDHLVEVKDFMDYWFTVDTEGSRFGTTKTRAERYQRDFFAKARRLFGDSVNPS